VASGCSASETTCTVLDEQREELQKLLGKLAQQVRKLGFFCRSVFLDGDPAEQISTLASDIDANDLRCFMLTKQGSEKCGRSASGNNLNSCIAHPVLFW
jgi:hypothetical protein